MAKITTITNPLTGQPAQVDQLEHTAQQIDDATARALPGGDIDKTFAKKVLPDIHNLDPVDGWTVNNGWGGLWYAKTQEGIVILHIAAINDAGFSDNVQLATLPEGYRPARSEAAVGFSQAISDSLFGINIDPTGRVYVRSLVSGVTLKYIIGASVFRASS